MMLVPLPSELPAHYSHNLRIALYSHFNIYDTPRARLIALAKVVDLQTSGTAAGEFEALPEGIVKMRLQGHGVFEPFGWDEAEACRVEEDFEEGRASLQVPGAGGSMGLRRGVGRRWRWRIRLAGLNCRLTSIASMTKLISAHFIPHDCRRHCLKPAISIGGWCLASLGGGGPSNTSSCRPASCVGFFTLH